MTNSQIQRAKSQTHEHLLSIVHTETQRFEAGRRVRLLDVGCGNGHLIAYLMENLPLLNPTLTYDLYGFDVNDHGVQTQGYFEESIRFLTARFPGTLWEEKLSLISSSAPWPYPDHQFDIIVSNQVLEHVHNHEFFFAEIYRTLRDGGCAVHLFPLKHHVIESHLWLPFIHQIQHFDLLRFSIKGLSRLGLGKYPAFKRGTGISLDEYAEKNADFIHYFTNYLRYQDFLNLAKRHKLRVSYKYTQEYYYRKVSAMLGRRLVFSYSVHRSGLIDWLAVAFLKYVSSVTLFLEKKETYSSQ